MEIKEITIEEMDILLESGNGDSNYRPLGKFIHKCEEDGHYVAIDNEGGNAWEGDFFDEETARAWLENRLSMEAYYYKVMGFCEGFKSIICDSFPALEEAMNVAKQLGASGKVSNAEIRRYSCAKESNIESFGTDDTGVLVKRLDFSKTAKDFLLENDLGNMKVCIVRENVYLVEPSFSEYVINNKYSELPLKNIRVREVHHLGECACSEFILDLVVFD